MPNIKPISDLRNYTSVVKEVNYGNRVYLTKNGHGQITRPSPDDPDDFSVSYKRTQLLDDVSFIHDIGGSTSIF